MTELSGACLICLQLSRPFPAKGIRGWRGLPIGMGVVDPGSGKGNRLIGPGSDGKLEPYERDSPALALTYTNKFLPPAPTRRERSSIMFHLI